LSAPKITAVNYSAGGTDTAQERTVTPLFPGVTVPPSNQRVFHVAGTVVVPSGKVLARPGTGKVLGQQAITKADAQPQPWRIRVDLGGLPEGRQELVASVRGEGASAAVPSEPLKMNIRTGNPVVTGVEPLMLDFTDGPHRVLVRFDEAHQLAADRAGNVKNFGLVKNGATTPVTPDTPIIEPKTAEFDDRTNSVLLTFGKLDPGNYKVLVRAPDDAKTTFPGIKDVFGNPLAKDDDSHTVSKPAVETAPTVRPGVHGFTGPYVPYPEYTRPRKVPDGFNPADHVETRVCRLYYSRNAHRVAQIINRNVRSYNREAVDVSRQLADKSRMLADQFTDNRRAAEREAIEAARQSREAERKLQAAQQNLNTAARELPAAQQAAQDEAVILEADKEATAKDLAVKNAELEQATAAAKDARAAADKIPASDPSKDAAEKLVLQR
jgi:hypothetical protein